MAKKLTKTGKRPTSKALKTARFFSVVIWALAVVTTASFSVSTQARSSPFAVSYSGRLTQPSGAPVDGPVDISVKFWNSPAAGNTLTTPIELTGISLNQGVFSLSLDLSSEQVQQIFGDVSTPIYIEITAAGKTYPRQQYSFVPLALRLPVDGKTLAFDTRSYQDQNRLLAKERLKFHR